MKVKIKEVLKLVVLLAGFCLIYMGLTIIDRNWYENKVHELRSEYQELDIQLEEFTESVLNDTTYVDNIIEYDRDSTYTAITAFIEGEDSLIRSNVSRLLRDTSTVNLYMLNIAAIKLKHDETISDIDAYILRHNRLVTRFPSNLVVGNNKLIK